MERRSPNNYLELVILKDKIENQSLIMKFEVFKQTTLEELNWYFQFIQHYVVNSWNIQQKEGNLLFPNLILFTETNDHFIFEL